MKKHLTLFIIFICLCCQNNNSKIVEENKSLETGNVKVNALLIGTFHFANFNPKNNGDILQINIPDIFTDENQRELEHISQAIVDFNPDKIFVEYRYTKQHRLDSIYDTFIPANYKEASRNEIVQLGFRVGKILKHKRLYAIDYRTDFPYDSLITQMKKAKQFNLIKKDSLELERIETFENKLFASGKTLSEILFHQNTNKRRKEDLNWYLSVANQGGNKNNFVGAYLASEWYRRNLYMYALIQKSLKEEDHKIMILGGSSHIGMFKDFIDKNPEWKTTELEELLN